MSNDSCTHCGAPRDPARTTCGFCKQAYPAQATPPAATVSAQPSSATWEVGWRWCSKCQCLFYETQNESTCPAGGKHDPTGSEEYALCSGDGAPGEPGWRWCSKCGVLFYAGNPGSCSLGGDHEGEGSPDYHLSRDPDAQGAVSNYHWCRPCGALFYAGEAEGACPADVQHDRSDANIYSVFLEGPERG